MKSWKKILLVVLLVLVLLLVVGPFLVPIPALPGTLSERQLADADSLFIPVNGLDVHYKERGEGEMTLILLHGFGASLYSWHEVMDDLSAYGRVIAYDRPAFGLTARPLPGQWAGESPYGTAANVELLAGLMDALGVGKAVLVGNSAGGGTAVAFAARYPERVEALVLVSPALGGGERFPTWISPLLATPQLRRLGPLFVRSIAESGNDIIRQAWHNPVRITPEVFEGYRKPLQAHNWDVALYEFSIAPRLADLKQALANLDMPILIMTGDDDRIVPTEGTIALGAQIPGAALSVLYACGHVPQEECPEAFMDTLSPFIQFLR